jgi:pyruvate/2-oxoglutarate dehydrogenase complex dihydrolipoamide dehydrogenase (E3) component
MTKMVTPDICVIGAGSAGLSVAAAAATFGVPVVLVERGRMGGDCLNYGCVPSKALIAAGKRAHAMRDAAKFGIAAVEPDIDFRKVHRHVHDVIAAIAPNDSVERFTALGVRVIKAEARFKDRRTLVAGDVEIRARRFVVATGSRPTIPAIPGIGGVDVLTNETVFDLTRRPGHLIVVGCGPIGVELAQAHRRLGCDVTIVEAGRALGREDREMADIALRALREDGVVIREGAKVASVERRGKTGVRVHVETADGPATVDGTHILVAAGRAPNVEGLDLAAAGVSFSGKGIRVNDRLRSTNRRVYAIGDVTGGPQFTHVAGYHASLVLRPLLFRLSARVDPSIIPRVTYTDPELAHVGMSEEEALRAHKGVRILRWPLSENDRAQTERQTTGLVKLIASSKGRILGASIVGANAGEMIGLYGLAIGKGMGVRDLASWLPPYPTMSEIGKRASITYFAGVTRKPGIRALIRFLRVFG